jgi:FdhD protein
MAVGDPAALTGLGYAGASMVRPLQRLSEAGITPGRASIAEEIPVAFVYNAHPHVVVMATPADYDDLAVGFSVTESIVSSSGEIERVEVVRASHGVELQIQIPDRAAARLSERTRSLASRTGCGLCGVERIEEALRVPPAIVSSLMVSAAALWRAGEELRDKQALNNATNTVHAAGWANLEGELTIVREDVGRHNALDKLIGSLDRSGMSFADGFVVVTSRASYELVQKVATCGIGLLAAISRPTGLAIRFADAAGITLVGLLRGKSANVYAGAGRISHTFLRLT